MLSLGYMSLAAHSRCGYLSLDTELRAGTSSHCIKLPLRAPDASFSALLPGKLSHFLLVPSLETDTLAVFITDSHFRFKV